MPVAVPSASQSRLGVCVCAVLVSLFSSSFSPSPASSPLAGRGCIGFSRRCGFSALCFALFKRLIKTLIAAIKKLFSSMHNTAKRSHRTHTNTHRHTHDTHHNERERQSIDGVGLKSLINDSLMREIGERMATINGAT